MRGLFLLLALAGSTALLGGVSPAAAKNAVSTCPRGATNSVAGMKPPAARFAGRQQGDDRLVDQICGFLGKARNPDSFLFGSVADQAIEYMAAPIDPFAMRLADGYWIVAGFHPHEYGVFGVALLDKDGVVRAVAMTLSPRDSNDDHLEYWIYLKKDPQADRYVTDIKRFNKLKPGTPTKVFYVP